VSCERFEEMIVLSVEGEIGVDEGRSLDQHLGGCSACRSFAAELRATRDAMAALRPADPGDAFFVQAREQIWREARQAPAPGLAARLRHWLESLGRSLALHRRALAGATVMVAASLALAIVLWPRTEESPSGPAREAVSELPRENGTGEALAALGSLSRDEKAVLEEEDPEGVEGQIQRLSAEELQALDQRLVAIAADTNRR
jgi:anti-sigma factor RsiW